MRSKIKTSTKVLIAFEIVVFFALISIYLYAIPFNLILVIVILYDLKSRADFLIIDVDGLTIKNWLTFDKRKYLYRDFDKVVVHLDPLDNFGRHNIYLLKGDIIFSKVSGRNFSNLVEIVNEIDRLKKEQIEGTDSPDS